MAQKGNCRVALGGNEWQRGLGTGLLNYHIRPIGTGTTGQAMAGPVFYVNTWYGSLW